MDKLNTKTAFITGGTKGIGFGIAQAMMAEGINVAITGRSRESAEEIANGLNAMTQNNAEAIGLQADVRHYDELETAVKHSVEAFGKIDILVANAGLGIFGPVGDLSIADWDKTIATNLSGVFYTLKAGLEQLKANKGYFFAISSLAGTNFFEAGSAYNASKFGVTGFAQAAMLDLRKHGIKTSMIMPGSVATHFNGNVPDESDAWKIQKEDIGELIVDLLKINPRTLPSKIEVRPSMPPSK